MILYQPVYQQLQQGHEAAGIASVAVKGLNKVVPGNNSNCNSNGNSKFFLCCSPRHGMGLTYLSHLLQPGQIVVHPSLLQLQSL